MKKKLVVLSGAGVSAESGIKTFRDAGGLWEGHNVMEVASPEGWRKNPALVLDFYNKRRQQLFEVVPNKAHTIIAELENHFDVTVITQNVDDLHERGGSTNVVHLHGELLKARCTVSETEILDWQDNILQGTLHPVTQKQLRPHIVWFGEAVPAIEKAMKIVEQADYIIVIGTSMQVYPAAGLVDYTKPDTPIYYIDLKPAQIPHLPNPLEVFPLTASEGVEVVKRKLMSFTAFYPLIKNNLKDKLELDKDYLFGYTYFDGFTHRLLNIDLFVNLLYEYEIKMSFRNEDNKEKTHISSGNFPEHLKSMLDNILNNQSFQTKEEYNGDFCATDLSLENYYFNINGRKASSFIYGLVTNEKEYFISKDEQTLFEFHTSIKDWTKKNLERLTNT